MSQKRSLLVYGAGAIGRGYIPWVYDGQDFDYHYVEANPELRGALQTQRHFTTFKTTAQGYEAQGVTVAGCYAPGEEGHLLDRVDGIITCVGPRNFDGLEPMLGAARVPVVCCENDADLPRSMRERTGNPHIVFAIPDVITSSTASDELLARDPLAVITEDGTCFAERGAAALGGHCSYIDSDALAVQWAAKLYIHNTPHCIAAYLGNLLGARYLHDTMRHPAAARIVEGAMHEMRAMLEASLHIDPGFLAFYAAKERARFKNTLLCDPISRVAREPFRKLALNERLIGAAQRCLAAGILPRHLMLGIMAAFRFASDSDPDYHIKFLLRSLSPAEFLRTIIRLRDNEALFELLIAHWGDNMRTLEGFQHDQ